MRNIATLIAGSVFSVCALSLSTEAAPLSHSGVAVPDQELSLVETVRHRRHWRRHAWRHYPRYHYYGPRYGYYAPRYRPYYYRPAPVISFGLGFGPRYGYYGGW